MSWLIALGGLAVAALALWLNYKERAAALRGSLYAKQFEVYGVVLCALGELHGIAMTVTTPPGFRLDGPGRLRLHQAARPQVAHLAQVFTETLVFLPQAVADAIVDYYQTLNGISAPPDEKPAPEGFQPPPELLEIEDPLRAQQELVVSFARLWGAMRKQIGTDPFSEQTLKLLGAPRPD